MKRFVCLFSIAAALTVVPSASAATGALVSVGSPTGAHPQNASNEPALAVDPVHPNILAAGSNDLVDTQPCSQQASTTAGACSFPLGTFNLGVGLTGDYFSFDSGHTWVQPTYQGLTAADCDPTVEPCNAHVGPIHTVPNYYENGLRSRGDPGVAFGPAPGPNGFSWANGERLYSSSLATSLTDDVIAKGSDTQNSTFAVTVSHIDNPSPARIQVQSNWSQPYFAATHVSTSAGVDKEQVWADNAASSRFFGNVYVCYVDFHSFSRGNNFPLKPMVATSTDGGLGQNNEKTMVSYSLDHGQTWSTPTAVSLAGDRSAYSAPAIAPDGSAAYVVYMAFTQPFQTTTASPRPEHGVLLSSTLVGGVPTGWSPAYVGPTGDARGTSQGRILYNEFLGDYVYTVATRTYGAGVWTDTRRTVDCPAMDAWRQASFTAGHRVFPAPWPLGDCPGAFGNDDIFSASTG